MLLRLELFLVNLVGVWTEYTSPMAESKLTHDCPELADPCLDLELFVKAAEDFFTDMDELAMADDSS